jgi:hypothetical protein
MPEGAQDGDEHWLRNGAAPTEGRNRNVGSTTKYPMMALSRCRAKSASGLGLTDFQAAATASRHVVIAAARSAR